MHIVLHEPEIPGNTGNIGRSCAATNTSLHLIEPLGFDITEKELRRAGLDYWAQLDVHRYRDYQDFLMENFGGSSLQNTETEKTEKTQQTQQPADSGSVSITRPPKLWFATTKAKHLYCEADFGPDDYIMFGKESAGIPEEILVDHEDSCIRIPMGFDIRSLNLSNAVAVVLYEALRQNDFPGLEREGELHRLHWK
ncbi:MAG: tRNA (cytidine(34)-2'-O)-methyltransferase [Lachnospiraceae bacterium]|nr:tRNA (cytidine(34)-2'-O)-methyltransferase [Lachnospiraceae bacterium]